MQEAIPPRVEVEAQVGLGWELHGRAGERVHGEDVVAGVADPGGRFGDRVEDLLDDWADRSGAGAGAARRGWAGGPGERQQVLALGVVELQCVRDAVEYRLGGAREVAAFHPDVVVDADSREQRDLFPAQALDPAVAAVGGQARLAGVIRARREARNSRTCARLFMPPR